MAFDRREFLKISAGVTGAASLGALTGCANHIANQGLQSGRCRRRFWRRHLRPLPEDVGTQNRSHHHRAERDVRFLPVLQHVLAGINKMEDITFTYDYLKKPSITGCRTRSPASTPPSSHRQDRGGNTISYDRLVLGRRYRTDVRQGRGLQRRNPEDHHARLEGRSSDRHPAQATGSHADGGTFVMSVPMAPYRCPPGPTSALARSPPTSSKPSRSPRSSSSTATRTSPPRRACSWPHGRSITAMAPTTA
jgi:sulfide dehydrogenase [flavocytochrome c] flavoprotein chain